MLNLYVRAVCKYMRMANLNEEFQMENQEKEKKIAAIGTEQKLGIGIKIMLTVIVVGAVAAGLYLAITLSQ